MQGSTSETLIGRAYLYWAGAGWALGEKYISPGFTSPVVTEVFLPVLGVGFRV